jgi:hypothetical protein
MYAANTADGMLAAASTPKIIVVTVSTFSSLPLNSFYSQ